MREREQLEQYITRKEHREALEDSLSWSGNLFLDLERRRGGLRLERHINKGRVPAILEEVTIEARKFLGDQEIGRVDVNVFEWSFQIKHGAKVGGVISGVATGVGLLDGVGIEDPLRGLGLGALFGIGVAIVGAHEYTLHSPYDRAARMILLGRDDKTEAQATDTTAYALAYHLLHAKTYLTRENKHLTYGFAVGFENAIGERLAEIHDDPSYRYLPLKKLSSALKDFYLAICQKTGVSPRKTLEQLAVPNERGGLYRIGFVYDRLVYPWNLGVATVAVGEQVNGQRVYRSIINEDLSFLRT